MNRIGTYRFYPHGYQFFQVCWREWLANAVVHEYEQGALERIFTLVENLFTNAAEGQSCSRRVPQRLQILMLKRHGATTRLEFEGALEPRFGLFEIVQLTFGASLSGQLLEGAHENDFCSLN